MEMRYFSIDEFDSPDLPNSGVNMDNGFLTMLDNTRSKAGIPFKITSGYRTAAYNEGLRDKGYKASPNSSHLRGYAADIAATDSATRYAILKAAIETGFKRIGIAKSFIHLDNDPEKQSAVWTY
jgi:uncharacterized protein YcbK (DUF882 family)